MERKEFIASLDQNLLTSPKRTKESLLGKPNINIQLGLTKIGGDTTKPKPVPSMLNVNHVFVPGAGAGIGAPAMAKDGAGVMPQSSIKSFGSKTSNADLVT